MTRVLGGGRPITCVMLEEEGEPDEGSDPDGVRCSMGVFSYVRAQFLKDPSLRSG